MPFELRLGARVADIPDDFVLAPAGQHQPTPSEQTCLTRINGFVADLTALADDGTPRGGEKIRARDVCLRQLRSAAADFVANQVTADDLLLTSYNYEGRYDEQVAWAEAALIAINGRRDPDHPDEYIDIEYDISRGATADDLLALKRDIDKSLTVVKAVLAPRRVFGRRKIADKRHEYIRALISIARVGLSEGNIALARNTLETLQGEFVAREASWVKNNYVRRLGFWSAFFVLLFAAGYLLIRHEAEPGLGWRLWLLPDPAPSAERPFAVYRFRNFLLLAIGASLSAWLAFLIRRPTLDFTGLVQLDDDLLRPPTRVVFTIVLSFVVGLLFWTGMISIQVGDFSTHFENSGMIAILIGVFCGIASRALATAVSRRAEDFAGNVGAAAVPPPQAG